MLADVDLKTFKHYFPKSPHPFISEPFINLNKGKTEGLVRLIEDSDKKEMGLIAGLKNKVLHSPFSAPFGGFHFRNEIIYTSEVDSFISLLKEYISKNGLHGIDIILPPDIYHSTFNAKTINSLIRNKFISEIPEITSWIDLNNFDENFSQKNSRESFRQAIRNGLIFKISINESERKDIYELIRENRAKYGRPIYMSYADILNTGQLWPVDFFKVSTQQGSIVASAIFYRNHPKIVFPVYWGDNESGRPLKAMDFLSFNLWKFYKEQGYKFIDMGISTEAGWPNEGLLRFKESHDAISSLRYKFSWRT